MINIYIQEFHCLNAGYGIENAEVCVQCGERMYSLGEMRRIEKVREKIKETKRKKKEGGE